VAKRALLVEHGLAVGGVLGVRGHLRECSDRESEKCRGGELLKAHEPSFWSYWMRERHAL
jgi:hypothetical protein